MRVRAGLAAALCWLAPAAAGAELVVLSGGHVLKVDGYRLDGDRAVLALPGGGTLTLPLLRVERVVDDEIAVQSEPLPAAPPAAFEFGFHPDQPVPGTPFGALIFETAARHLVNPALVAAMVAAESAFDPVAVSPKGASGLLQLMPATADRFGVERDALFDPVQNLDAGVRYLKWLHDRFAGDLALVLAGYNAGEATVERYDGVPPFRETRDYIRRIYASLGVEPPSAAGVASGSGTR